jgi:hypothetical protein
MKLLKSLFSLSLLVFVFIGSTGFHVYRSVCVYTGKTSFVFNLKDEHCKHGEQKIQHACCSQKAHRSAHIEKKCCNNQQIDSRVYLPYSLQKSSFAIAPLLAISLIPIDSFRACLKEKKNQFARFSFQTKPPLKAKQILFQISCLRL